MSKKVLIAGYPKSGNTWIVYLLSYILGAKYIELDQPDGFKPTHQKEILELIEGNLPHESDYDAVCKTHKRYNYSSDTLSVDSFDKVIHIVRDPRDIAVSYYFYTYYNAPIDQGKPEAVLSQKSWIRRKYYWKKTVYRVAYQWPLHCMCWRTFEGSVLLRYEDLHKDCLSALRKICDYLEYDGDPGLLQKAMEQFTFERLSGGRKQGQEYSSGFFRKGIIGDYKNHFSWVDTRIMKRYAGKEMQDLGYEI